MTDVSKDAAHCAFLGAGRFDLLFPGWATGLDASKLNVASLTDCPLVVVLGVAGWPEALSRLTELGIDWSREQLVAMGFMGSVDVMPDLTLSWQREVLKRCLSPNGSATPSAWLASVCSSV